MLELDTHPTEDGKPWTVNTKAGMERQLDLGVDGIITDYPTRLRALMEERGMKLPKTYKLKG